MENITIKDPINKLDRINYIISELHRLPICITIGEETANDILMFLTEYKNLILNTKVEIEV